ncbi:Rad60-SLD domain-containing protein [Chloropicon primus]|uniref:Rad60/SUMO-like domain-containing protein n=1 Tax=Chloropicon primus TaxID=1764295 RepID=A0A5B8MPU0_9CHLO|nr:hypothetical protein A3770_06p41330 [Chloropicon primus]UPR00826.1 Rad60-SLD domain-containing protein [Chloropicon primus]|eukprot:QDZ21615.1 hypothetical protein A3770_06p41330 [Chloropicon primus]
MHELWDFAPPTVSDSDDSDSDGTSEDGGGRGLTPLASHSRGKGEGTVIILDSSCEKGKRPPGDCNVFGNEADEFELMDTPLKSPKKRRRAGVTKKREKQEEEAKKLEEILKQNAATVAKLKGEKENVDGLVKALKSDAAREASAAAQEVEEEEEDGLLTAGISQRILISVRLPHEKDARKLRLSMTDKFSKVFEAIGGILGGGKKFVLSFDGEQLDPGMTPQELDMEDEDLVDVHLK